MSDVSSNCASEAVPGISEVEAGILQVLKKTTKQTRQNLAVDAAADVTADTGQRVRAMAGNLDTVMEQVQQLKTDNNLLKTNISSIMSKLAQFPQIGRNTSST